MRDRVDTEWTNSMYILIINTESILVPYRTPPSTGLIWPVFQFLDQIWTKAGPKLGWLWFLCSSIQLANIIFSIWSPKQCRSLQSKKSVGRSEDRKIGQSEIDEWRRPSTVRYENCTWSGQLERSHRVEASWTELYSQNWCAISTNDRSWCTRTVLRMNNESVILSYLNKYHKAIVPGVTLDLSCIVVSARWVRLPPSTCASARRSSENWDMVQWLLTYKDNKSIRHRPEVHCCSGCPEPSARGDNELARSSNQPFSVVQPMSVVQPVRINLI